MEIPILARTAVPTPTSGNGYLFFDSGNANALTVKFIDCSFKVLSAEPYQLNESQSLLDAQNDFLDVLKCGVKNGTVTMTELQTLLESFQLYYSSTIDSNGNLNQSISYAAPAVVADTDFGIDTFTPVSALGDRISLSFTNTIAQSRNMTLELDRMGGSGDISVSLTSPVLGITLDAYSYTSNSLGAITTSAQNVILDGVSYLVGSFDYDGTSVTTGTFTGTLTITKGTVSKFISVLIEVLP